MATGGVTWLHWLLIAACVPFALSTILLLVLALRRTARP